VEVLRAAGRGDPPARAYARAAGRVSRLFMTSLPVQEALCWLARHARALQEGARTTHWQPQHHGALVERIRHVLDTIRDALGPADGDVAACLPALEAALDGADIDQAVASALARTLGPDVMAADGEQGDPRAIALTSDPVGDRHRRRRPHRADRDRELERPPFARASVRRAVHRSPR
jgi:hypothetical protein